MKPTEIMRIWFGESQEDAVCGTCCNLRTVRRVDRTIRKCVAYGGWWSSKADFAKSWPACGLYGKPVAHQRIPDAAKAQLSRLGKIQEKGPIAGQTDLLGEMGPGDQDGQEVLEVF